MLRRCVQSSKGILPTRNHIVTGKVCRGVSQQSSSCNWGLCSFSWWTDRNYCRSRLILGTGLKVVASSLILAHNHPSGNLKASTTDFEITKRLVEAGKLMDISVLDHIIVTSEDGNYLSMADNGLI